MKRSCLIFISALMMLAFVLASNANAQFTINDLMKVRRVGDPQLSPDGKWVAFTIGDVNKEANRVVTHIYLLPIEGGEPKQLTSGDRSSSSPRWSPDGKKIAFVTGSQLWTMDADGDDKEQITKIATGAGGPVWSPDGQWIAFTSDVYPECQTESCNKQKEEETEKSKVQAKVTTRLLYRHWVEWRDRKRTHVFIVSSRGGESRDMTPGDFDSPPYAASTGVDYAFSPDSKELAFLRNPDKVEATSTNSDIYVVAVGTGGGATNITTANKGYDVGPVYSSDGKYIIYRSQTTATFEADRWRVMVYDRQTKQSKELTVGFDLQAEETIISPDNKTVYFIAGERGLHPIYSVSINGGPIKKIVSDVFATSLSIAPDGRTLVFLGQSMATPPEVYRSSTEGGEVNSLTKTNASFLSRFNLKTPEEVEWTGALGKKIHGYLLKPANFDANKKWPLLVLIHGGPQSAWNNNWSYRWNSQVFANAGYVVFMPNPRGSTGFGQKFINEISGDWGGKVYTDLMNGVADVVKKNSYLDKTRIGGAGASYGGYMVNWILGHNNDPRFKFKVFVSHAGVYNLESMAGVTEELWFTNWEFKGQPWTNPAMYARWSPHKFVTNFKTPTLVIHGELDYRVPVGEGLQLYTALQTLGVDSKLIVFPDEGHWILKPQNSEFWYNNVLDWLEGYLKG